MSSEWIMGIKLRKENTAITNGLKCNKLKVLIFFPESTIIDIRYRYIRLDIYRYYRYINRIYIL